MGLGGGSLSTYTYANGNPADNFDPAGLNCWSKNGITLCSYPDSDGPAFKVPTTPGYPAALGPTTSPYYHKYDISRELGKADHACVMAELRAHATPGASNGASEGGTENITKVPILPGNPVTSYETHDLRTGNPLIVNVAHSGGIFSDGYVVRGIYGGKLHTAGEGTSVFQSPDVTSQAAQDFGNWLVWGRQMDEIIQKCTCEK